MALEIRRSKPAVAVCWVLVAVCMVLIFVMSSQPASESDETSGGFIKFILRIFRPDFDSLDASAQEALVDQWQHAARKTAHFMVYAILGALFAQAYLCYTDRFVQILSLSWLCTSLYAATDELHQRFVPGRSGEIRDIAIDCVGALLGILISFGLTRLFAGIRKKKLADR